MKTFWLIIIASTALMLNSCSNNGNKNLHGYVDANLIYVSSPVAGKLITLDVQKGNVIKQGQLLFSLEQQPEHAKFYKALASLKRAQAQLNDLETGQRPSQIKAIQEQIASVKAKLTYTKKQLKRYEHLIKTQNTSLELYDQALQNYSSNLALLKQYQANLTTAKLPARHDQIKAAEQAEQMAQADLAAAMWALSQKQVKSPAAGMIFDTLFRQGEQVAAAHPVVSILNYANVKIIFFVPEQDLAKIKLGAKVKAKYDGAIKPFEAKIIYIAPKAQYTPPVIYSHKSRAKLVYLIEAKPDTKVAKILHLGQPVDVSI